MAHILVLHPSLTVRMDLKTVLEAAGYRTTACSSTSEAQSVLHTADPDLLLADLTIVENEGKDLADEMRSKDRGVLLLGAEDEWKRTSGAYAFCALPYERGDLLGRVEQVLQRQPAPRAGPPATRRLRILAIDDSMTYRQTLAEHLTADGYEVLTAASGQEGLEVLNTTEVDCILLDLLMEGLSGEETCRRIRSAPALRLVPVIMLTALEDRQAMVGSFAAGADDFVSKSSDPEVLKARMAAQLRRRQNEDELRHMREELHRHEIEMAAANASRQLAETRAALLEDLQRKNSELQKREEELRSAKAIAEQANAAKDQFLAVLSHELRTPLTPVLAAVQLMQRRPGLDQQESRHLEMIRRNLELEARLIDDLLDLTRIVRGKIMLERKPVDLCTVIDRVADICRPDIETRRLHFGIKAEDTPLPVCGDVSRLQQIFWNLLKNSIKFTPEGGCIGIHCHRQDTAVVVEVTDSGIGIEPEATARIFNAFEQADRRVTRQFGGLGLGLAITKRLLDMHDGTIAVHSKGASKGATFKVTLPLYSGEPAPAQPSEPALRPRPGGPRRILLVEDHGDTALMMQLLLEASGYEVATAGDLRQALNTLGSREFDVLVSDLGLPDGSGLELMKELRQQGQSLKGIALSGFGREEDVQKSREAGFAAHLTKPVAADVLIETVEGLF